MKMSDFSIEEYHKKVEDNYNLLWSFLNKFHLDPEEFYGDAAIGLCKAAIYYDESYGVKFSTFAYRCMQSECLIGMRSNKKLRYIQFVPMDRLLSEDCEVAYANVLSNGYTTGDDAEALEFVRWFIEELSMLDLQIIWMRIQGMTYQEIADNLSISKQYANLRMKTIKDAYMADCRAKTVKPDDNIVSRKILIEQILADLTSSV